MSAHRLAWLAVALLGCSANPDLDSDGDGLTDGFEALVGSDPGDADSDGDGCSDAVEVLTHFDPTAAADRPYQGRYPRGPRASQARMDGLIAEHGEGYEVGKVNPNWRLQDQNGDEVELRDFYGQVVVIDLSAEWCGPCREAAEDGQQRYEAQAEQGFVILQLLIEGLIDNDVPQPDRWIDDLGVTYPVLADHSPGDYTQTEVAQHYIDVPGASFLIPAFSLIDRQQRIVERYVATLDWDEAFGGDLLGEPAPEGDDPMPDNAETLAAELGIELGAWRVAPEICD